MSALTILTFSELSWAAIGAWLANHLWQSTVFAGVVWLLALLLRKNRAETRYSLWLIASAKFLLPFSVLIGLGSRIAWPKAPAAAPSSVFVMTQVFSEPFAPVSPPFVAAPTPDSPLGALLRSLPFLLLIVWSCGCAAVLFLWWRRRRRLTMATRGALRVENGRELEALRCLEQSAGMTGQIELRISESALEPGVLGIFEPVLLLPKGISNQLSDAQLETILTHELCHVRRHDNLAAALHMWVAAIFWFHPLLWWIAARLVDERERACDEEVLRLGADPHIYAESILKVCKFYLEPPLFCAAGVTGSNLKKRIEAIMLNRIGRNLERSKKVLLGTMGGVALVGPIVFGLLHSPQSRAELRTSNPAITPAFELASVQPSRPGDENMGVRAVPGRLTLANWTVKGLLVYAYNTTEIQGGPDWVNSQKYDIDLTVDDSRAYKTGKLIQTNLAGRFPPGLRHDQLMSFLQSLVQDRFKLSLSHETTQGPVYALVIGKNGPKLHESSAGDTYADGILGVDGLPVGPHRGSGQDGHLTVQALPMSTVAELLTEVLGRTVLDETGLTGEYDFSLEWTPDKSQAPTNSKQAIDGTSPESAGLSIFSAIQEQLGLKLESQERPVEVLEFISKPCVAQS